MSAAQSAMARMAPTSFADLVEAQKDTVVNVYTTQKVQPQKRRQFNGPPSFFDEFFGQQGQRPAQKRSSLGSGVITSADGYILTNNHVVENSEEINVRLANHEEYAAIVIGRDKMTDLALIKITPKSPLRFANMGNSQQLRVGDWVVAIGNPFGFEQTVTAGIVSGKGRNLGGGSYENFIQTDASINPGNSGGPLFNLEGEMVGINTAIYSRSGGNIGIGFAIPVNTAKNVMGQLKARGTVTRGWLGVHIQTVNQDIAEQFGLDRPYGALVGQVVPEGPADKGGLKPGDIILEFQNQELSKMSMLPTLVAQAPINTEVSLIIFRKGKEQKISVTIGKLETETPLTRQAQLETAALGLTLQDLNKDLAETIGLDTHTGVIVTNVEPFTPAASAGFSRGDIILEINQVMVTDLAGFSEKLSKLTKSPKILFLIKRGETTRYMIMKNQ
ncbi:MAG: DegQ family serine endoprotease [Desulfobulbaceae bacterium]|nr:DegQ family serine endoprotease [Desulfobulbaceae bacterium]